MSSTKNIACSVAKLGLGLAFTGILGSMGCTSQQAPSEPPVGTEVLGVETLAAEGAVSCDFGLPATMNPSTIGPIIERDRMYMSARPGFTRKYIPFFVDALGLNLSSGGRYLFATEAQARKYYRWVQDDFILDGVHFLERAYFIDPVCHVFSVIGAADIKDVHQHHDLVRTERWSGHTTRAQLEAEWPGIVASAQARGLTGVRLFYSAGEDLVELMYTADRAVISIAGLELSAPLGGGLVSLGMSKSFDRTQFVLSIWFPFAAGDQGEPAAWVNSPPLPGPSCGDGVCEPSRGESHETCASDCTAQCGDAVCQSGENTQNCPSDCRI